MVDWYFGKMLEGRSRLSEQVDVFDELNMIVKEEQIDVIVMVGDVFDIVNLLVLVEQLFYESLFVFSDRGKCLIVVIVGNYDNFDCLFVVLLLIYENGIYLIGYLIIELFYIEVFLVGEFLVVGVLVYLFEVWLNEVFFDIFDEKLFCDYYDVKIRQVFEYMISWFCKDVVKVVVSYIYVVGGN